MADPFVGEIRALPYTFVPQGWARCDGQSLPVNQNQVLYAVIGNQFGGNNGNFRLPNLQARTPMGIGSGPGLTPRNMADNGGAATISLTIPQLPAHQHSCNGNAFAGSSDTPSNSAEFGGETDPKFFLYKENPATNSLVPLAPQALTPSGGNLAHENQQPWLALQFCIALDGTFPVRP